MRHGPDSLLCVSVLLLALLGPSEAGAYGPFGEFEARAEGHSWVNTYLLAYVSDLAHRDRVLHLEGLTTADKFSRAFDPLGLRVVAFLQGNDEAKTDTQALVLRTESIVLVAFSGSETHDSTAAVRDWIMTDARVQPLEIEGVRVHRGFHLAVESVWEVLLATITGAVREEGLALWLTGHSLGGALANLAAWRLDREGFPVAGVCTFASPKVGGVDFVADFEERFGPRSQQWSTKLDPVTRMPEVGKGSAYEKLGVTNVVHASGEVELDTVQKMSGVPNPLAHRSAAYLNYLYRALPEDLRSRVPGPPPLCRATTKMVGLHPDDGYPICLSRTSRSVLPDRCLERGGEIVETWCVRLDSDKYRYRAQKLKKAED